MNKNFIIITVFLAVIAATTGALRVVEKTLTVAHVDNPDNPDSFIRGVVFTQTDENGDLHNIIRAEKVIHFQSNDAAVFQKIDVLFLESPQKTWRITADHGDSEANLETVHLIGNVNVFQPAGPETKETTITTNSATVLLHKKYVFTDQLVNVKQPGITIEAKGANADFNIGLVNLLSQVKQTYLPSEDSGGSVPLSGEQSKIAFLNADQVQYDRHKHISEYSGNIMFTQGTTFLKAQKLLVYDVNNKIYQVTATGAPAHYSTIPNAQDGRMDATAKQMQYFPQKNIAVLIGDSKITQNGSEFAGPNLTYDFKKHTIISQPVPNALTTIVIPPSDK